MITRRQSLTERIRFAIDSHEADKRELQKAQVDCAAYDILQYWRKRVAISGRYLESLKRECEVKEKTTYDT